LLPFASAGIKRERSVIEEAFGRLMVALRRSQQFRFSMDVLDSVVAKVSRLEVPRGILPCSEG
jgi:hypothetical protein